MIPLLSTSDTSTAFEGATPASLSTSAETMTMIINQLSTLYTDPIYAIIREYVANGIDAHRMYGIERPVDILTPNDDSPQLVITSYVGMSRDEIQDRILTYGNSDKRGSNDAIGMLGYGAKSGLALVPSVFFESVKDGLYTIANLSIINGVVHAYASEPVARDSEDFFRVTMDISSLFEPHNESNLSKEENEFANYARYHEYTQYHERALSIIRGFPTGAITLNQKVYKSLFDSVIPLTEHISVAHYHVLDPEKSYQRGGIDHHLALIYSGGIYYGTHKLSTLSKDFPAVYQIFRPFETLDRDQPVVLVFDIPVGQLDVPIARDTYKNNDENRKVFTKLLGELENHLIDLYTQDYDYSAPARELYPVLHQDHQPNNQRLNLLSTFKSKLHNAAKLETEALNALEQRDLKNDLITVIHTGSGAMAPAYRCHRILNNLDLQLMGFTLRSAQHTYQPLEPNEGRNVSTYYFSTLYISPKLPLSNPPVYDGFNILVKENYGRYALMLNPSIKGHLKTVALNTNLGEGKFTIYFEENELPTAIRETDFDLTFDNCDSLFEYVRTTSLEIRAANRQKVTNGVIDSVEFFVDGSLSYSDHRLPTSQLETEIQELTENFENVRIYAAPSMTKVQRSALILSSTITPVVIIEAKKRDLKDSGISYLSPQGANDIGVNAKINAATYQRIANALRLMDYEKWANRFIHFIGSSSSQSPVMLTLQKARDDYYWLKNILDDQMTPHRISELLSTIDTKKLKKRKVFDEAKSLYPLKSALGHHIDCAQVIPNSTQWLLEDRLCKHLMDLATH